MIYRYECYCSGRWTANLKLNDNASRSSPAWTVLCVGGEWQGTAGQEQDGLPSGQSK